jgi:hypothetical protein
MVKIQYKIIDRQGTGVHNDDIFDNLEELRQHLINYHSSDWEGNDDISKMNLSEILDYGNWDIESIKIKE